MKPEIKLTTQISTVAIVMVLATAPASANWFSDKFKPQEIQTEKGKIIDETKKPSKKSVDAVKQQKPKNVAKKKKVKKKKDGNWFQRTFKKDKNKKVVQKQAAPKKAKKAKQAKPAAKRDMLLIDDLKGIAVLGKPNQVKVEGVGFKLTGVRHMDKSVVLPDNVKKVMKAAIGKPLTLNSLSELTKSLQKAYAAAGIQISTVIAPEQDITDGALQLIIVNGRLGNVKVINNKYFDKKLYLKEFTTKKNEVIKSENIIEDLRWMNRNQFRRADLVYVPSSGYGRTDIEVRASETKPQSFYAGVNNSGTALLGKERYYVGAQFGNLFQKDHQFSVQYTTNQKSGTDLDAISLGYRIPLENRQEVRLNGSYSEYKAPVNALVATGKSSSFGGEYFKALPRVGDFGGDLHAALQYKSSENASTFNATTAVVGGGTITTSPTVVNGGKDTYTQASLGWHGERQKVGSRTLVQADMTYTSGDKKDLTSTTDASFAGLKVQAVHTEDFKNDTRLTINGRMQLASNSDIPSGEEFYLGGANSVRGFNSNVSHDPDGLTISTTYRGPNLLRNNPKMKGQQVRPYAFIDSGFGYTKDPGVGELSSKRLSGAGVGVTYNYGRNVSVDLAYGAPINDDDVPVALRDSGVLHGSVNVRY